MGASAQVSLALACAKASCEAALNTTLDKLTAAQRSIIDGITTDIGYIENRVIEQLRLIVQCGATVIDALSLHDSVPQLSWYSRSYLNSSQSDVTFQFNGIFCDAARTGFTPTLSLNGHTFTPVSSSTLQLSFKVPLSVMGVDPNGVKIVQLWLSVPYRRAEAFGALYSRQIAQFYSLVSVLPAHAGTIEFDTDQMQMQRLAQPNQSGEFFLDSTQNDIPDPIASGRVFSSSVTPGWFINPAEVTIQYVHTQGEWHDLGNRSNVTTAAWSIAAFHREFGLSGKINFILHWTEYQDKPVQVPAHQTQQLEWNSSRTFTVPAGGTWAARYTDFRGESFDIDSAAFTNPYIMVSTSGNTVMITTIP